MNPSSQTCECDPLMEACTLTLYQKNIFRITGLPVDATAKEIAKQAQRLQMLDEMGGSPAGAQPAFPLKPAPTNEQIRGALARMKEPEHRLVDEFFWYWPDSFGNSKGDAAIQALLAGDAGKAVNIWIDQEQRGSFVARHNLAIMYHMYAVDWTNYHVAYELDPIQDEKIKEYWRKSFERWEKTTESDELWDTLRGRVRALEDDALTTGFVRRMRSLLPQALDRVNAEAALKLAEQGRMDWAKFHVDLMHQTNPGLDDVEATAELVLGPTRKRVQQQLESSIAQAKKAPQRGPEIATQVMERCAPLMEIYDLFHGREAHQRNDLFDEVAETVVELLVGHQKTTGDNHTFVNLLKESLRFATGAHVRERIIKNISIGEGNLVGGIVAPLYKALRSITESSITAAQKLNRIQNEILSGMPALASRLGTDSAAYHEFADSLALAIRGVSIDAHNDSKDFKTAEAAIQLALRLAVEQETKRRIHADIKTLADNKAGSICYFCGVEPSTEAATFNLAMYGDVVRHYRRVEYRNGSIPIQRCTKCKEKQTQSGNTGSWLWAIAVILGVVIGAANGGGAWIGGGIVGFFAGWLLSSIAQGMMNLEAGLKNPAKHPNVREMLAKGWSIGNKPS